VQYARTNECPDVTNANATLKRLEQRLRELPLLPRVVIGLLELDPKHDDYYEKVVSYISADPSFAARVLQFANSTAIAAAKPSTTLRSALMLVGAAGAVNYIVARSAVQIFMPRANWQRNLWYHALYVAALCRRLAQEFAPAISQEQAHLAGLLHDIGRLILYLEAPEQVRDVEETDWLSPEALIEAEKSVCGFTHAELGYLAACKWGLPKGLAALILHHHADIHSVALSPNLLPLLRILKFSDRVAVGASRIIDPGAIESLVDAALRNPYCPSDDRVRLISTIRDGLAEATAARMLVGL
jgi:putative nucleotidyltransferase with HDIG domain